MSFRTTQIQWHIIDVNYFVLTESRRVFELGVKFAKVGQCFIALPPFSRCTLGHSGPRNMGLHHLRAHLTASAHSNLNRTRSWWLLKEIEITVRSWPKSHVQFHDMEMINY